MPARVSPPCRLQRAREEARGCRRCPLWTRATQTVFGEGPARTALLFVGEQPGDREDVEGHPFVGPAGRLLRRALADAGIDPDRCYLTNAVKHFKWRPQGKRRIHERPNREELLACRHWLEEEIAAINPALIVALGATAASVVIGSAVRVTRDRGQRLASAFGPPAAATVHPSSILRSGDSDARARAYALFVEDLRTMAALAADPTDG